MVSFAVCSKVKVLAAQLCLTLCNPMDFCSPAGSSVHGILQARILQWVAISFSRGSSWPRDQTLVSRIAGKFFTIWPISEASQKNLRGYIKQRCEHWPPGSLGQWFLKDGNKPGGGLPARFLGTEQSSTIFTEAQKYPGPHKVKLAIFGTPKNYGMKRIRKIWPMVQRNINWNGFINLSDNKFIHKYIKRVIITILYV